MSATDDAYKEAQRLIAQAKKTGSEALYLDTPKTRALTRLPKEIADLSSLKVLNIGNTRISYLTPIVDLPNLRELYLANTSVVDLRPLADISGLSTLYLSNSNVTNLAALSACSELRELYLARTRITDISPLSTLTELCWVDLAYTGVSNLTPLGSLTKLIGLKLNNTKIDKLTPLASLAGLRWLYIENTLAQDLAPLCRLAQLMSNPEEKGLTFKNTAATRADPRIAEIAEIEDNATRARELFAYLEHWVPPGETPSLPPKPDPILETILIDGKLELAADLPSMAEQAEPLKKALHQRLKSSVPDLARAAGNIFPKLAAKARVLAGLVDRPFADLDLLAIHFEIELLQDRQNRGTEDDIPFSDDVLGPLSDVTRNGPGLTVGHEAVDLYLARVRLTRDNPLAEQDAKTHQDFSTAIIHAPDAHGARSISMQELIAALDDQHKRQAGFMAKHQWVLWTLTTVGAVADVTSIRQIYGPGISTFIVTNYPLLQAVAQTYGGTFFNWFAGVMGPILLALGVKTGLPKDKK